MFIKRDFVPIYEFTFIAQQGLTQYEVEGLIKGLTSMLSKIGCKVLKQEYWGLRDLAYDINKMGKGHYAMLCIEGSPSALDEFKRKVNLNEDIMRFLCVGVKRVSKEDSMMLQSN